MKKKALATSTLLKLIIGVIVVLVVAGVAFPKNISKIHSATGTATNSKYIENCENSKMNELGRKEFNNPKYDIDEDGVFDDCDVCVLKLEKQDYMDILDKFDTKLKDRGYVSSKNKDNDKDSDGIVDGCDSDLEKKAKPWLGFIGNAVETECKKVAKRSNGELMWDVIDSHGYKKCHLKQQ